MPFIGSLFLIFFAAESPNTFNVVVSLALLGFGLGFTMGAPVNYMMLENISDKEAGAGLATLSLIRSIGTTIAPALMVGFIAHAGLSLQTNIMEVLPDEINVPNLPYVQEISSTIDKLKSDPNMADKLSGVDIPDLSSLQTVKLDFSGGTGDMTIPDELLARFKTSDVTTITSVTKLFASSMFDQMSPQLITRIQSGIKSGIDGITSGLTELEASITELQDGYDGIGQGVSGMQKAVAQQEAALSMLKDYASKLTGPLPNGMSLLDMVPADVKASIPASAQDALSVVKSSDDLEALIKSFEDAITDLNAKIAENQISQANMKTVLDQMAFAKVEMTTLLDQMQTLADSIPDAFDSAETNYLAAIDSRSDQLQSTYQRTLNGGYKSIYLIVGVASAFAMVFLAFYRKKKVDNL